MFFTSLITPLILLVLYATFLAKVYRNSFAAAMPAGFSAVSYTHLAITSAPLANKPYTAQ